ncbi:MAG: hypothetical protein ICV84_11500 [Flavisolibacter sp.]|nr:hypothetical protein [Flavisolibacter sp.]
MAPTPLTPTTGLLTLSSPQGSRSNPGRRPRCAGGLGTLLLLKSMMIEISIDETKTNLHADLIFRIPEAGIDKRFDLYYFAVDQDAFPDVDPLVELLKYWIEKISSLGAGETGFFPIDFSDEYTGCLKVSRINREHLLLAYGNSRMNGFSVSPSQPKNYYKEVQDFEFDDETIPLTVDRDRFLNELKILKEKTENGT